jgi:hypothetical protein
MIRTIDEKENYLLITNGTRFAVVERRVGLYYRLLHRAPHGVPFDDAGEQELFSAGTLDSEAAGRKLLDEVASELRGLAEHMR